ncbi:PREDICTED: prokineticin Bo8-like [Branchiostoma belcheri]|uniref:Prokineticin Bo8-like n=1 Tax=Branchiostoma belcheri TaxID=7741 RepID=A0A6P4Z905_BRABE|nr:PREDICTED: prokineticin Bo8-like [Branchiostoma belcheri]
MFSHFFLLLLACIYSAGSTTAITVTGACTSDEDCISARGGGCCVRWNPGSAVFVCKDMGQENDQCHVSGNLLPYPFPGKRVYWRCPCGEGLTCARTDGESGGGTCQTAAERRSVPTERKRWPLVEKYLLDTQASGQHKEPRTSECK